MNKRVIGIMMISTKNANYNAGLDGSPRKIMDNFIVSPFAGKYSIRKYWKDKNLDVFTTKTLKEISSKNDGKDVRQGAKTLDEKLANSIEKYNLDKTNVLAIQNGLFKHYVDISCFGGIFTVKADKEICKVDFNEHYTGAIQFGYGVNCYDNTNVIYDIISSPFVNSNKSENEKTTLGNRELLDEAHFAYKFTVNPNNYSIYKELDENFVGLTDEAYNQFKIAAINAVTYGDSVAKIGAENEMTMFIELKEGSMLSLPSLEDKIVFHKKENNNGKDVIDLTQIQKLLKKVDADIEKIEIYHYEDLTDIIFEKSDKVTIKDILTSYNEGMR